MKFRIRRSCQASLRVLKVEPDSLDLQFGKTIEKRIAIAPRLEVIPARGYTIVGEPTATPQTIMAVGTANVLDSLAEIPTQTILVTNAHEDVDRAIPLSDSLDNFIAIPNAQNISVHVSVQAIGERKISGVPIEIDALPPQFDLTLFPGTVTVTVRGGVEELATLTPASRYTRAWSYNPMLLDTAQSLSPNIEVPKGLTYLSTDPPALRFIIRRKNAIHVAP